VCAHTAIFLHIYVRIAELASHPEVLEVSVVARLHPRWGERPMAFVTLRLPITNERQRRHEEFKESLKAHAKARLPGFACPEWVEVVEELPVSLRSYLIFSC
jgi:acyl-CoA synthetase (AMP-forming)/AMP-acid ligase II